MQDLVVILMLKRGGVIEKELGSVKIGRHGNLLHNVYVTEEEDAAMLVRLFITVERDLADWEFQAVFDHYDTEIYDGLDLTVTEVTGEDNPVWEISFALPDLERLGVKIMGILNLHSRELAGVMDAIKDSESEYNDL